MKLFCNYSVLIGPNIMFSTLGLTVFWFSNGQAFAAMAIATVPSIWTLDHSKSGIFCPVFKWLGFRISDPIQNPNHLQPNHFLTIQNPYWSGFQIPTVFKSRQVMDKLFVIQIMTWKPNKFFSLWPSVAVINIAFII